MKRVLKRSTVLLLALLLIVSATALTVVAQGTENGFGQENGNWYYYKNSQIDTSRNDVIQGTVNGQDGWWYVVGGQVQLNYTGVANYANAYGWWYIKNGKVDFSCNSVEQNNYGWWYVVGGKVQFGYTGVANYANNYGWWYIKDGKVDFNKTGVEQNNYGWWRVVNGKVDFNCNSVEQNDYGWWYLVGGRVQFGYTGVADYANAYGWWYIRDGKVDFGKTGVEQNSYGWWRVVNGKVDFSCNSVEENQYGWWYLLGGQVQFGYTGVANYANAYGWWYIRDGKVDFGFSGVADNKNGSWYVKNGKVDFTATVYDVNHLSQKQGNMIAPLSSFLLMNRQNAYYNKQDQFWSAIPIIVMRYPSYGGSEVWLGGGGYIATERYIKECAYAMFADFDGNIPVTEQMINGVGDPLYGGIKYYDGCIDIPGFDSGAGTGTQISSWVEHPDGTCTVEVEATEAGGLPDDRLKNGILEVDRFELVKNQYTASLSSPVYTYTIASMETVYKWSWEKGQYVYS